MPHKIYIQYPMQMIERQINLVIDRRPELINTINHTIIQPITRNYSHIYLR